MERDKLVEYLRYCTEAGGYSDCLACPFRDDPEFPDNDLEEAMCADTLMRIAADALEEG